MKVEDLKKHATNLFEIMLDNAYQSGYKQGQIDLLNERFKELEKEEIKIKVVKRED